MLALVFAAAGCQGADFASTKPTATVWGGVIGLAAFFAWLAVDEEEATSDVHDDEDDDEDDDDDGEGAAKVEQPDRAVPDRASGSKPPDKLD